jgi:DNA-3-methyladenine glycosylase
MPLSPLTDKFFESSAVQVARELLGMRLVRLLDGQRLSGYIIEAEAYLGESDLACHARSGHTPRTQVMYGPPGRAYVYFVYGMHWMLNCVTGIEGDPQAVLVRAIWPDEGLDQIASRRAGVPRRSWTDGPGKICRALAIDGSFNGASLLDPSGGLWIAAGQSVPAESVITGPRVGIDGVPEPWLSKPWRFRAEQRLWQPPDHKT